MSEIKIDPRHMVHAEDPKTSHWASHKIKHGDRATRILDAIKLLGGYRSLGGQGCISDDLQEYFGISDQREEKIPYSGVTGYFAKLERLCLIERTGATRKGHRFGRFQEIMWALTEEERLAKLFELEKNLGLIPSPALYEKIIDWFNADSALAKAKAAEEPLREEIVESLIPSLTLGKYKVPLGLVNQTYFELHIVIRKNGTSLTIRPVK